MIFVIIMVALFSSLGIYFLCGVVDAAEAASRHRISNKDLVVVGCVLAALCFVLAGFVIGAWATGRTVESEAASFVGPPLPATPTDNVQGKR